MPDSSDQQLNPSTPICGFAGLGAMGMPIALRLATAVGRLAVSDIASERVNTALAAAGPVAVEDHDLLERAQTVYLCLPSQAATRSLVETLLDGPAENRTFIDFGAQPPDFVADMSDLCEARSAHYCDSPVFGTPSMAQRGDLYFLFSGLEQAGRDFAALAGKLGYRTRYAGPTGTASTMKLLQNAIGTANLAIAAEALSICEATGASTGLFIDVVRECGGIGMSTVFDRFADDMAARKDSGEGRLRIAAKDMHSVAGLAASLKVTTPLLDQATNKFERAMLNDMGEHQFTDIIKVQD